MGLLAGGAARECREAVTAVGCHCNPGAREVALDIDSSALARCFSAKDYLSYGEFVRMIEPYVQGVVRVSLGLASNFADVYRFLEFARGFVDRPCIS